MASSPLKHQTPNEAHTPLIYAAVCAKCSDDGQMMLLADAKKMVEEIVKHLG